MEFVLALFGLGLLLELLQYSPLLWPGRKFWTLVAGALTASASILLLWRWPSLMNGLIALLSAYRMLNLARVIKGRMNPQYLRRAAFRTTLVLALVQLILVLLWSFDSSLLWFVVTLLLLAGATALLVFTIRSLKKTAWPARTEHFSDSELPTVSVAIPARNETDDLQACLQSLIASDYPKLEILVLDDCSQNRRTPEIIRSFAHEGVRFVKGEPPSPTWLPKNHAYDRLSSEASGEYILFCDTDIRFEPDTLRKILNFILSRNKKMLCLLPQRTLGVRPQANLV